MRLEIEVKNVQELRDLLETLSGKNTIPAGITVSTVEDAGATVVTAPAPVEEEKKEKSKKKRGRPPKKEIPVPEKKAPAVEKPKEETSDISAMKTDFRDLLLTLSQRHGTGTAKKFMQSINLQNVSALPDDAEKVQGFIVALTKKIEGESDG